MNVDAKGHNGRLVGWHSNAGYTLFCQALYDNRLKAGMNLTQSQLSEILGMSLSPLRETLVLLEDSGLVEIKPRAGVHIFYPDVAFIRENMQFRSMIELFAVPIFMRNMDDHWIKNSRATHVDLLSKWESHKGDRSDALEAASQVLDRVFHDAIVAALGNGSIEIAHKRTRENVHIARKVHQTSFGKLHYLDTIAEHMKFLDAVEAKDSEAAMKALEEHFRAATHRLFVAP